MLTNPVCRDPAYAATMAEILPALVWLDKEIVMEGMAGKEFYDKCRAAEERQSQAQDVDQIPAAGMYMVERIWDSGYLHHCKIQWNSGQGMSEDRPQYK